MFILHFLYPIPTPSKSQVGRLQLRNKDLFEHSNFQSCIQSIEVLVVSYQPVTSYYLGFRYELNDSSNF